jgi:hypothetical protein
VVVIVVFLLGILAAVHRFVRTVLVVVVLIAVVLVLVPLAGGVFGRTVTRWVGKFVIRVMKGQCDCF